MASPQRSLTAESFGHLPDGTEARLYHLTAEGGLRISLTDYGAAITQLHAPDAQNRFADVVLGYDTLPGYLAGKSFFGAAVGRYANRLAHARFTLEGHEYHLAANNGANHLHGGVQGFNRRLWTSEILPDQPAVKLTLLSPDGEEGYPGTLHVEIRYSLEDTHTLRIDYQAETDRATPINLTNHSFFNLAGHAAGSILDHEVTLFAEQTTRIDRTLIPTGELRPVAGTPLDFRAPHRIGERIAADDEQLRFAGGYDHNFVLAIGPDASLVRAARVREPRSGRVMEVLTTEPGLQFYSGNFMDGTEIGKGGVPYPYRTGFCLETQHFPDSPNHPSFPSTIIRPGAPYRSTTLYRFAAE